jgi:hypothetical protein
MWYIFVLFYLCGAVSASSTVNITDLYGTWVPLTPLNWTIAQNCGNNTLMISTTFQLGNASLVEKFLVGSGNSTDEEDFIKSVVLAVETWGDLAIDYDYDKEKQSNPLPAPPKPVVKIPAPSPNPFTVKVPAPDQIPEPSNLPVPEPVTKQPEFSVPVPVPSTNQVPTSAPETDVIVNPVPEPDVIVNPVPEPDMTVPSSSEPNPNGAQDPEPAPGMKRSTEQDIPILPEADNSTEPEPAPAPSLNNATMNETTNFTSQWVHVYFTPKTFNVSILSNETDIYYIKNGPCMHIIDYWENAALGCPCNGTWNNTGYYNESTKSFEGGRQITPSLCPNNTCQEALYLNDTISYANLRLNITTFVGNGTIANKTVELTRMSPFKDIGYAYNETDIIAVFLLSTENITIPVPVVTAPEMNETINDSGSMSLPLTSFFSVLLAFLLIMYENTQ